MTEDPGVGRTVEPTAAKMKQLGKTYDPHIFEGAAHGFLRAQTGNNGANMKATQQAWPLTVAWIKKYASYVATKCHPPAAELRNQPSRLVAARS